jgi:DNA-binding transcriptional ArsR family regulator
MSEVLDMAAVAALVGDPARANILCALLDGRALTAGELAYAAHVSPQTASGHLAKLALAHLITSTQQGRHRYYALAGPHVATMLESIMAVAAIAPPRCRPIRIDDDLRAARMCYDHIAGQLGVGLANSLRERAYVELTGDGGELTSAGDAFLQDLGIDMAKLRHGRRVFCRPCIDWSERRPHLAGAVGAALAQRLLALSWIKRVRDSRALKVTSLGQQNLALLLGLSIETLSVETRAPRLMARG